MMRSLYSLLLPLALLFLCMARPAWAQAPDADEPAGYRETVESALAEYELDHFTEARSLFERAHQLSPSARTLRGLGMVEFELRHYSVARGLLEASLQDTRKPLTEEQRQAVEALLARTDAFVGRYALRVEPASEGITLELDGKPVALEADHVLTLEAGDHRLLVRAPGMRDERLRLDVRGTEKQTLQVVLQPAGIAQQAPKPVAGQPPSERPYRTVGITLVSVGSAVLAAGAVVGGLAYAGARNSQGEEDPDNQRFHAMAIGADVGMAVGVLAAATGVALSLVRKEQRDPDARGPQAGLSLQGSSLKLRF